MMARVSIREVAALADVAHGTVSNFLNHPERVSADKRERIQRAIDQLGYIRNNAAWQLRLGRSGMIAYLAPDVSNPFFATIAEGVERRASEHELGVSIANSHRSREREDAYIAQFESQRVQGMLVSSHHPIEDRLRRLHERGTPTVLVGQRSSDDSLSSISIDDRTGGRLAAEHLLSLGRRRIAFVGGPLGIRQVADRFEGASSAIGASGTATIEVIPQNERTLSGGREVGRLIGERSIERRPDAIFAVNDLLALGIMQELVVGHGIRVPHDIAIIGYDDIEFGEASLIPLSSIRAPHEDFGVAAVDLLVNAMAGDHEGERHIVFPPELVVRASTAGGAGLSG